MLKLMWLSGRQVARLEGVWWKQEMSDQVQIDLVEGGRGVVGPKRTWLGQR